MQNESYNITLTKAEFDFLRTEIMYQYKEFYLQFSPEPEATVDEKLDLAIAIDERLEAAAG